MPTWKVSSFELNALGAEMLELDYLTEPSLEGKSHLRTGEENPNCIRISASWQQAASNLYGLIKINKKLTFSFHGSLNCNLPLLLGCKSCSFTHPCTTWCMQYSSWQVYLGRKALPRCNNVIHNLFLWWTVPRWGGGRMGNTCKGAAGRREASPPAEMRNRIFWSGSREALKKALYLKHR